MKRTFCAALIIAAVFAAQSAMARTWRVEQDGSGDFQIIQHAVNAAASGDTVRIGPGEFTDHFQVDPPQDYYSACVQLQQAELTIIGAGADSTFIGPQGDGWDGWDGEHARTVGIFADGYWGNQQLLLQELTVRNLRAGILSWRLEYSDIHACAFNGNRNGVYITDGRFLLRDSWLGNQPSNGSHLIASSTPNSIVENCTFEDTSEVEPLSQHIGISWSPSSVLIRQCYFRGGYEGFAVGGGVSVQVTDCTIEHLLGYAFGVGHNTTFSVDSCRVSDVLGGLHAIYSGSDISIENTNFDSISQATAVISGLSVRKISYCNLDRGLQYVATVPQGLVLDEPSVESRVDIRNNWWGTSDPDSIQAWIFDAVDDTTQTVIFDWYPYLDAPVGNEDVSPSSMKRMFK